MKRRTLVFSLATGGAMIGAGVAAWFAQDRLVPVSWRGQTDVDLPGVHYDGLGYWLRNRFADDEGARQLGQWAYQSLGLAVEKIDQELRHAFKPAFQQTHASIDEVDDYASALFEGEYRAAKLLPVNGWLISYSEGLCYAAAHVRVRDDQETKA